MNKTQRITAALVALFVLIMFTGPIALNSGYASAFAISHAESA